MAATKSSTQIGERTWLGLPLMALLAAITAVAVFGPATAQANVNSVIQSCKTEGPFERFTKAELEAALPHVPADADEYSSCSILIREAIAAKAIRRLPGGSESGVKGARAALRSADANDLTTPAERKKIASAIEDEVAALSARPLTASTDPSVYTAPGKTLASTTAAGAPAALIIGVFGLLLLIGTDLFRRLGSSPRAARFLPWSGQSGSD